MRVNVAVLGLESALLRRAWTCVGVTELHVLTEMAKALRAISEGRVPK